MLILQKREMKQIYLLILVMLNSSLLVIAQENTAAERNFHNETPDDPYIYVDKSLMPRQAPYQVRRSDYFTTQVNIDAQGMDIIGDAGNEPSLAVDPTNPDRIVIGWRQFDVISNNFRQAGYSYSLDGGQTFTNPGVLDPGNFRSDPVLDFDRDGNFYYNSLQGTFACDVFEIDDGGVIWSSPKPAFGGDKQWMRLDRTDGIGSGNNYSYWNFGFTTCASGQFTRSTDGSETFEECILIDEQPFWGTLAVDKDGTLYITGRDASGDINVIRSTNAKDPLATIVWDQVTEVDLGGSLAVSQAINPSGLSGQAWVDVDISDGPGEGNVYVCASVTVSGDPVDVMFAKSTDGGATFEPPIRINNDDTGNYNWFGTLSVAPNGRIDVIWLDTRNSGAGSRDSRLFYTFSEDQGATWSNNEVISEFFDPNIGYPNQNKMGDYIDMVSDDNYAHIAWANTLNGGQDVYYTRITPVFLGLGEESNALNASVSPNPFTKTTQVQFSADSSSKTTVDVYDIQGRLVETIFDGRVEGNQTIEWSPERVISGIYFVSISNGNREAVLKAIQK